MIELNANETYGLLAQALPPRAARPGVLYNGDLMVYGADTLVIFTERSVRVIPTPDLGESINPIRSPKRWVATM